MLIASHCISIHPILLGMYFITTVAGEGVTTNAPGGREGGLRTAEQMKYMSWRMWCIEMQ